MNEQDEERRIQALYDLNILDTPTNPAIDELVEMVANLCDMPSGAVTILDADRYWVKSGFHVPRASNIPRELCFCSYTTNSRAPFIIEDATKDPKHCKNPYVTQPPFVIFYAGVPLILSNGEVAGSLVVLDSKPRTIEPLKIRMMQVIAKQVVEIIEREFKETRRV